MKYFYPVFLCLLLVSCSKQDDAGPRAPVADSTMIDVLIELHLAEARVEMLHKDQIAVKDSILRHYGLSREAFEANMAFYKAHPDAFHKLYSEALDKLSDERYMPGE